MKEETELTVGEIIGVLRRRNDWTLRDLAKESGVSSSTLSRMERNNPNVRLDYYVKVAKTFGFKLQIRFTTDGKTTDGKRREWAEKGSKKGCADKWWRINDAPAWEVAICYQMDTPVLVDVIHPSLPRAICAAAVWDSLQKERSWMK